MALALLLGVAGVASAEPSRIERREVRQEMRIRQGERSGQLTKAEARKLQRGQRHVRRMEWRAAHREGRMGMRDRHRIQRAQNRQSRRIWRMKHNRRHARV
jgi:hypothetical protein